MLIHLKRIFRRLQKNHEWNKRRRISDYRATSLAVRLVLSGSLTPATRGVSMIGRPRI